jgi:hypothetical protein
MFNHLKKGISTLLGIGVILILSTLFLGITYWQYSALQKETEFPEETCQNKCGDGVCNEVVCLAIGCPCAETKENCPEDCEIDETADWETYRNEEYGFELRYQTGWTVKAKDPSYWCYEQEKAEYDCLVAIEFFPPSTLEHSWVNLIIYGNPNEYSTTAWLNEYMSRALTDPQIVSLDQQIKIGGEYGVRTTSVNGCEANITYVSKEKNLFSLRTCFGVGQEETEDVFNQILSTFRFLDSEIQPEEIYIEVLPPEGELVEGEIINIKWRQKGLEGKNTNIYLFSYGETYHSSVPKEEYRNGFGYLIAEDVPVIQGSFQWNIPIDLSQRYPRSPSFYKFNISSTEELSSWGVELEDLKLSQSKEYFEITVSKE